MSDFQNERQGGTVTWRELMCNCTPGSFFLWTVRHQPMLEVFGLGTLN